MKLKRESIKWALNHLLILSDSDLFPRPIELDIINELGEEAIDSLSSWDLKEIKHGPHRKFIVPKDELSYRVATQLDPLDSIFLAAIIYEFGANIEKKRIPKEDEKVFSYRFSPDSAGHFYDKSFSWSMFWSKSKQKSANFEYVVLLDIADFYNQIYHHSVENQLLNCNLPKEVIDWIMNLLKETTVKVSRGIPVGPHSTHLLAEISLNPIDNSLKARGVEFSRYIDDFIIYCNSEEEARSSIYIMAEILDKQQRLILQRHKSKILKKEDFQKFCDHMIEDRPINDLESCIISIIKKYSGDNPYKIVYLSEIADDDLKYFNEVVITKIFNDYLNKENPNFVRLRWFIRRLSQVGHPSALRYLIENFDKLTPAISDICHYFVSVNNFSTQEWPNIGEELLRLLDNQIIKSNEYFQISIYSLFNRKTELNHLDKLLSVYKNVSPFIQREIIIAAYKNGASDWIRELKESYRSMDPWSKRAYLVACSILPKDEKKFFLRSIKPERKLDELIIKWAKMA